MLPNLGFLLEPVELPLGYGTVFSNTPTGGSLESSMLPATRSVSLPEQSSYSH